MIPELLVVPVLLTHGILGTLNRKFTSHQEIFSGITICIGSPREIVFQSESNGLFHLAVPGIVYQPVYAVSVRHVDVLFCDIVVMFHGSDLVIELSMSCSSMSPVAIVYACAELPIPPLTFPSQSIFSRKLVVNIVRSMTMMSPTRRADPLCDWVGLYIWFGGDDLFFEIR